MPRSHGVIKSEVWEVGSDFRRLLGLDAQWAFAMLISQPQINNLGVLPYVPERWSRLAVDLDRSRLGAALTALEELRYTITDLDTGELLVRTFIRHDAVWKQPRLVTNARRLIREVESEPIRAFLIDRHPWLVEDAWTPAKITKHETTQRPPETPSVTPLDTPLAEPLSGGVSDPRARVRVGLGLPLPLGQPQDQRSSVQASTRAVPARELGDDPHDDEEPLVGPVERPSDHTQIRATIEESLRAGT